MTADNQDQNETDLTEELRDFSPPSLSPDFYDKLDERLTKATSPASVHGFGPTVKRHWRSLGVTAVAAAAAIAVIGSSVLTNTGSSPSSDIAQETSTSTSTSAPPDEPFNPTLASQVLERAEQRYASVQGISGTSTQTELCIKDPFAGNPPDCAQEPQPIKQVTEFRMRSNGDNWSRVVVDESQNPNSIYPYLSNADTTTAYDADRNESVTESHYNPTTYQRDEKFHYQKQANTFAEMPEPYVFGHFTLQSLLDGLAVDQSSKLEDTVLNARPVWKIQSKGLPLDAFGVSPDEVIAYFDQETLFPLKVTEIRDKQIMKETEITDLRINPAFDDTDFAIAIPKDAAVDTMTGPWKTTTLQDLGSQISYRPLVPAYVPEGFSLIWVRTAKDAGASGPEGLNPQNRDVVTLVYGRGLQRLMVTTRLAGKGHEWLDPHAFEGQLNADTKTLTIEGGAYNDVKVSLVTGFGTQPHIWVVGATLVTTVIGDVSAAELEKVFSSLKRQ
jgi:outer membrane lipoprotein-sorting protein